MTFYTLSRMVLPDADFYDSEDLFFRVSEAEHPFNGQLGARARKFSFDTWMNLFAAKKWYRYCDLGELYLELSAVGNFYLEVTGHSVDAHFGVKNESLYAKEYTSDGEPLMINVPNAKGFDGVSFSLTFNEGNKYAFKSAAWCTEAAPKRANKIAVVTCTFKREDYIQKTIGKFTDFMERNPELGERMHLYVIDNGRTLPAGRVNKCVDIIPNKNLGGAGGFGRGLMEAYDGDYTRCLFMDDDVEIFPESFYRTLILADYFKPEYEEAFVNGPMLSLYEKNLMYENMAEFNGEDFVRPYHGGYKIDELYNVFKTIDVDERVFTEKFISSAWWYCCFHIDREHEEYPLPFFIRADDIEWSWRHRGLVHVSMNGISIWHAPFWFRVGIAQDCYYTRRNMFYLTARYQHGHKEKFLASLRNLVEYFHRTYNYAGMAVLEETLKDILKGAAVFAEDPEGQLKKINAIAKENTQLELAGNIKAIEEARDFHVNPHTVKYLLKKIIYKLTFRGTLLPESWYLKSTGLTLDFAPTVLEQANFLLKREVWLYNPLKGTREKRRYEAAIDKKYVKSLNALIGELGRNYERLQSDFNDNYARLTSRAFWEEYTRM